MAVQLKYITRRLEHHFPLNLAESWDNSGLQLGSFEQLVHKIIVALDVTEELIEYAQKEKADLIITHHPLLFNSVKQIDVDRFPGKYIAALIQSGIQVYSMHTNLDAAPQGINQYLAQKLRLNNIRLLAPHQKQPMYKITVYVPLVFEPQVRAAMHAAGAGKMESYAECSFRSIGQSTFSPQLGAKPFVGQIGQLEEIDEVRLEMLASQENSKAVIAAMLQAHPYEIPAYDVLELKNYSSEYSLGRVGFLSEPLVLQDFCALIKKQLSLTSLRVTGDLNQKVLKIGIVSGAGSSFISEAAREGCDVLITGDVKYHEAQEAERLGLILIDAGHQGTEKFVTEVLFLVLNDEIKKQEWNLSVKKFQSPELLQTL